MNPETLCQDVMQVCKNGHVTTDMLHTCPERAVSHCDRCGTTTIDSCPTCGQEIMGAIHVPGLVPIGRREPPQFCSSCGAAFPWTRPKVPEAGCEAWPVVESLLRRLPRVIRQLRVRQGDRAALRVNDERDLEDLLRALLPLHFDDVRPECRTASYAPGTSTDFLLDPQGLAIAVKRARPTAGERELGEQILEDADYYSATPRVHTLICLVYDPEGMLRDPRQLEVIWSKPQTDLDVRCIIAS